MPLSQPAKRAHLHTRRVECHGFRRDDGFWDIEGHLTDTKTYAFSNHDRGEIQAGEPIHEMWLRITVNDDFVIQQAEAVTEYGPFKICPDITDNFASLKGLKIQTGWRKEVNQRVGGVLGCTHLRELLDPIATTAFQTVFPIKARAQTNRAETVERVALRRNSCHAYASDSPVMKRLQADALQGS